MLTALTTPDGRNEDVVSQIQDFGMGGQPLAGRGRRKADWLIAVALAGGATIVEAADVAGVGQRTVYRRLVDPGFQDLVRQIRRQALDRAVGRLATSTTSAAQTLVELLGAASETVRLGAARAILDLGVTTPDVVDADTRITELENRLEGL